MRANSQDGLKDGMERKQKKIIRYVSSLACFIIALQMVVIVLRGNPFCLNEGCGIVEKLTAIPPLFFNLVGFVFFLVVFWGSLRSGDRPVAAFGWLRVLLLAGLATEGVLVGYQFLVARTFCSYCLVIFAIMLILNLLFGRQQAVIGVALFLAVFAVFAMLNFGPTALLVLRNKSMANGSFAIKRCDAPPFKQLYFFFSSDCPHCRNVLNALQSCNSCEFHFNPVDRIQTLDFPVLEYSPAYEPALNRLVLSLLGIKTIPVLLVKNPDELTFIKGEKKIIRYVSEACFQADQMDFPASSSPANEPGDMSFTGEQEGDCTLQLDCPDSVNQSEMPEGAERRNRNN